MSLPASTFLRLAAGSDGCDPALACLLLEERREIDRPRTFEGAIDVGEPAGSAAGDDPRLAPVVAGGRGPGQCVEMPPRPETVAAGGDPLRGPIDDPRRGELALEQ